MSENVQVVTDLPVKTNVLKTIAKRTVIASVAVAALAVIYVKTHQSDEEPETSQTPAA